MPSSRTWSSATRLLIDRVLPELPRLNRVLALGRDAVGAGAGPRGGDLGELRPVEAEGDAVVGGEPGRVALADEALVHRPPLGLAVVVRTRAPGQEAEAVAHPLELRPE